MSTIGLHQDTEEVTRLKAEIEDWKADYNYTYGMLQASRQLLIEAKEIIELKNATIEVLEEHVKILKDSFMQGNK